ncbi:MAG: hypothetical protein AB4368_30315 [Xenococcaceae cyanobacterium]
MDNKISQNRLIKEISLIPEDRHQELYDLIYTFRMGLNQPEHKLDEIMQFAGSWSDLSEEDFKNFYEEVEERR